MLARVLVALLAAGGLILALLWGSLPAGPPRVSGVVEADEIRVGSRVGGRVQRVDVEEGQTVPAGKILVGIEPFDLLERLAQAQAQLNALEVQVQLLEAGLREEEVAQARARRDAARAQLEELVAGPREQEVAVAREGVALEQAELELAELELQRAANLARQGAASQELLDLARRKHAVASARLASRRSELALLEQGTRAERVAQGRAALAEAEAAFALAAAGFRPEEVLRARHEAQAARALVASLERQVAELNVAAPVPSVVEALELQPGDLVAPNAPVLALRDLTRLWVRAYVPTPWLARLREGQQLEVRVDGLPELALEGTVSFVAREAEYTPQNVQTPEDRLQQVFRIKVTLATTPDTALLRPGMTCDVILPALE